ncbi:MAG: translation initiation factor IF-2 associated domain-containing protein, partial [Alphaproteobacteria bacterium]|nr:translation initiation factor IF-2 associated domain-containing protein [Alphaproteobacteria bacterium]
MTDESVKGKLTLKKTLTLKNVAKPAPSDGKKVVQVEVRKKRSINVAPQQVAPKQIDEATAQKLKLLAEAKEYEAKKKQEEEAKEAKRQKQRAVQ